MDVDSLRAELAALQEDKSLWEAANLAGRAQARGFTNLLHNVAQARRHQAEVAALYQQMSQFQQLLDEIDAAQVHQMYQRISAGEYRGLALRRALDNYTSYRPGVPAQAHFAEDSLDYLLRGVLTPAPHPPETQPRNLDMVHLEPSPARVALEFIDRVEPKRDDVFYDLGSGLGQIVLLVQLLTGMQAWGVEVEPAYVAYARCVAGKLSVTGAHFIHADARHADLGNGTLFYLFTPFRGPLLQDVLQRLHAVAQAHTIQIGAYGSCSRQLTQQPWLAPQDDHANDEYKLALFRSTVAKEL